MPPFVLVIIMAFSNGHDPTAAVQVPMSSERVCEVAASKAVIQKKVINAFCLRTY